MANFGNPDGLQGISAFYQKSFRLARAIGEFVATNLAQRFWYRGQSCNKENQLINCDPTPGKCDALYSSLTVVVELLNYPERTPITNGNSTSQTLSTSNIQGPIRGYSVTGEPSPDFNVIEADGTVRRMGQLFNDGLTYGDVLSESFTRADGEPDNCTAGFLAVGGQCDTTYEVHYTVDVVGRTSGAIEQEGKTGFRRFFQGPIAPLELIDNGTQATIKESSGLERAIVRGGNQFSEWTNLRDVYYVREDGAPDDCGNALNCQLVSAADFPPTEWQSIRSTNGPIQFSVSSNDAEDIVTVWDAITTESNPLTILCFLSQTGSYEVTEIGDDVPVCSAERFYYRGESYTPNALGRCPVEYFVRWHYRHRDTNGFIREVGGPNYSTRPEFNGFDTRILGPMSAPSPVPANGGDGWTIYNANGDSSGVMAFLPYDGEFLESYVHVQRVDGQPDTCGEQCFEGGQCLTDYRVFWQGQYFLTFGEETRTTSGDVTVTGPIEGIDIRYDAARDVVSWHLRHAGQELELRSFTASFGDVAPISADILRVERTDGQADNCGSLPGCEVVDFFPPAVGTDPSVWNFVESSAPPMSYDFSTDGDRTLITVWDSATTQAAPLAKLDLLPGEFSYSLRCADDPPPT